MEKRPAPPSSAGRPAKRPVVDEIDEMIEDFENSIEEPLMMPPEEEDMLDLGAARQNWTRPVVANADPASHPIGKPFTFRCVSCRGPAAGPSGVQPGGWGMDTAVLCCWHTV